MIEKGSEILESTGLWEIVLTATLVLLSAFFSMAETSLTSLSKIKIRSMQEEGIKRAQQVEKAVEDRERLLSSVLIGSNISNIALSAIVTSFALAAAGNNAVVIAAATAVATLIVLIFGELTPKIIAMKYPEKIALAIARPLNILISVISPISISLNFIISLFLKPLGFYKETKDPGFTESELKTMLEVSFEEGVIEHDEHKMMGNVIEFDEVLAKDVMTPRPDMAVISLENDYNEVLAVFSQKQLSRLPVFQENIDNIVGVLHLKDFILADGKADTFKVEQYMREPFFTIELKRTKVLFTEMRRANSSLAIILDEYGGTAGLLSMEDLIEEIVGEIFDEHDETGDVEHIGEYEYVVNGAMKIDDFNEQAGSELASEEYESLGGYVIGLAGSIPKSGDSFYDNNITFVVEEVEKNRIERLRIKFEREKDQYMGD